MAPPEQPSSIGRISMYEVADKQRLRAAARKLRASAKAADSESRAAERVAAHFMATFSMHVAFGSGAVVAGYWPLGSEMDVRPLMLRLAAAGVELALPVTRAGDRPLEFRRWHPGDALESGAHGVSQPKSDAAVAVPAVLLVPLLAFDAAGWRLGYGAGYYDRTLAGLRGRLLDARPLAIGIAYAAQEMADLPHHAGDQPLDGVVTEQSARRFS